jgi:cation:H+ antiporter
MPELVVSVEAAFKGSPDIAIGNVVGSNIANVLLIGGVAAVIAPVVARFLDYKRDLFVMVAASVALLGLGFWGGVPRIAGLFMVAILAFYLYYTSRKSRLDDPELAEAMEVPAWRRPLPVAIGLVILGLIGLFGGARLLVDAAIEISRMIGLSEAVIGLTVVAVGTSLPELATSVAAAVRKHADVALGNIVGSNIFNVLGILGVASMIKPIAISPGIASVDIPIMIGTLLLLAGLIAFRAGVSRAAGAALLALYAGYVAFLLA